MNLLVFADRHDQVGLQDVLYEIPVEFTYVNKKKIT